MQTTAMFDPRTYDGIRKPAVDASTLPPHCYTSPEFYRAEVEHLFMKVWNFLGRADRIPKVGD
ncbi:MAG: aromatic ring-hydroxylating dioxygenase subunit alpha, partial [Proteobacteria bacterium]|nr:aromatic ring-hydroxylating dioxygenase subunit alpha [Pseudomonadota bacterium]